MIIGSLLIILVKQEFFGAQGAEISTAVMKRKNQNIFLLIKNLPAGRL